MLGKRVSGGTIKKHPPGLLKLTVLVTAILMALPLSAEAWGYAEYNGLVHQSGQMIPLPTGFVLEADADNLLLEAIPSVGFQEELIPVKELATGRYGYLNTKGEIAIQPQFTLANHFSEGMAAVALDENYHQWGWINPQGDMVIAPIYDAAGPFLEGVAWASVYLGETLAEDPAYGYLRKDGSLLTHFKYYLADNFKDGMAPVCELLQWGFVNLEGEEIIPPQYDWVSSFVGGLAVVRLYDSHGLVNPQGELMWLRDYDTLSDFHEGHSIASRGDDIWILTPDGQETSFSSDIQGPLFFGPAQADGFREGRLPVITVDGTQGYADVSGELVISGPYEQVFGFRNGLSAVMVNTDENSHIDHQQFPAAFGFIDLMGNMVIDPVYPLAGSYNEGLCPVMTTEGLWGAIDIQGRWVIEPVFAEMGTFVNGYAPVVMSQALMAESTENLMNEQAADDAVEETSKMTKTPGALSDASQEVEANHSVINGLGHGRWFVPGIMLLVILTTAIWLKMRFKKLNH